MAKLQLAYTGCHWEIVVDDIFFPTEVYLVKNRQTNWRLVSNCQRKEYCRLLHLSGVDRLMCLCLSIISTNYGLSKGDFS